MGDDEIPSLPGRPAVPPRQPYAPLPSNEAVAWWHGLSRNVKVTALVAALVIATGITVAVVKHENDPCVKAQKLNRQMNDAGQLSGFTFSHQADLIDWSKECYDKGGDPTG